MEFKVAEGGVTPKKKDEKLKKFHLLTKGITPKYSFDEVKKELVKNLELSTLDKADDIINSVRDMELLDVESLVPMMGISTDPDEVIQEAEQERLCVTYRQEYKNWGTCKEALNNNKRKLHGKILKLSTQEMEQKLERESDYDTTLYRNPISLLERIRKFMTTSEETDYQWFHVWETLQCLLNCKQGSNETPYDFWKRIEENAKATKALLGDDFLAPFARTTKGYEVLSTPKEQEEYVNRSWEMFLSSGMMFNCDRARYQSQVNRMNADYMVVHMDYNQRMTYPQTLHNATETLNWHKPNNSKNKFSKKLHQGLNHLNKRKVNANNVNNNNVANQGTNFAQVQTSKACFICGGKDHMVPGCPHRTRPKSQWVKPEKYDQYSVQATGNRARSQTDGANNT